MVTAFLLAERGVKPKGGWRMVVQLLGVSLGFINISLL